MTKAIRITEEDYREIMRWDDDGGACVDIDYIIIDSSPRINEVDRIPAASVASRDDHKKAA
jgi:hypothetical protein